jgi:hypothetical protein
MLFTVVTRSGEGFASEIVEAKKKDVHKWSDVLKY